MLYYIYKIENTKNHKIYIGLTNNIARRWARHLSDLKHNWHDNQFLQKEFNIYGEKNFNFTIECSGDFTDLEIGEKEKEYIKYYNSYYNGYNQNEGGNFGASNGGSQLIQDDILNILSALEFCPSKSGATLATIYGTTRTTINRIKKGINHNAIYQYYWSLPIEKRQYIYQQFCNNYNFYEKKIKTTIIPTKRKLTEEQVHCICLNQELKIISWMELARRYGIKSCNTFTSILHGLSYKDYIYTFKKLNDTQKKQLASLLSN